MRTDLNACLQLGAALSALAAMLHVAVIAGGPGWHRFFDAGERVARLAASGSPVPALVTLGIAVMISGWAQYAASGAGLVRSMLAGTLSLITAIYLLRGLALMPVLLSPTLRLPFNIRSSSVCPGFGLVHLAGLVQVRRRI